MQLKDYQRRVVDEVETYLHALEEHRAGGNVKHAAMDAWDQLRIPGPRYNERRNRLGEDLPNFCVKVPTGGGKTLIATQALGSIHRTILRERNGSGLVLWVVPSSQIYRDTLRRLRDRRDMYRLMLEHAVSRRIEVWEKKDIARLTPARLRDCLNILIIQLASTNRETKEQLKFFRDSGGNIVQHFPPESNMEAHRKLKEETPNLDMLVDDPDRGQHLAKTSVGNLVRLCRPAVILDEGHKATSQLAQSTLEDFNASIIVELSATPHKGANVLCRVSGEELLAEEMIKLPLNIATSGQKAWKDVLTQARDKRAALAKKAAKLASESGWEERGQIRPIVLVQVERTGKDQRDQRHVHTEDVREYLMQTLDVPASAIAVKSSAQDEIEKIDLDDPGCPVAWIITKAALQEGWDCPFAYILVSLSETKSTRAMTQLVGRILRQPYQRRTPLEELNESYVFCRHATAGEIARDVKKALEREGYEGDVEGLVVDASGPGKRKDKREIRIREHFRSLYHGKAFEGKIYLPRFCVKEGKEYAPLDYFGHLIGRVDVDQFEYNKIDWPLSEALKQAKDRFYRVTLGQDVARTDELEADLLESDEQVIAWIVATLKFEYLSHKELKRIAGRVYERLLQAELSSMVKDRLGLVKFAVRERTERFVQEQIDKQTEAAFDKLFDQKKIRFYLECAECRFEIPESVKIQSTRALQHTNGDPISSSLFDYVEHEGQNEYERAVALCLDKHADVLWWFRNRVGPENFSVQGYRKNRIYPDFVVQSGKNGKPVHRVVVVESKGAHLEKAPDTMYKRKVAAAFETAGKKVSWQQLGEDFKDHVFRFQILDEAQEYGRGWGDELQELLASE